MILSVESVCEVNRIDATCRLNADSREMLGYEIGAAKRKTATADIITREMICSIAQVECICFGSEV